MPLSWLRVIAELSAAPGGVTRKFREVSSVRKLAMSYLPLRLRSVRIQLVERNPMK